MGKFPEVHNLPRLNHDETENLNKLITGKEINQQPTATQQTRANDQKPSLMNSTKHSKMKTNPSQILSKN